MDRLIKDFRRKFEIEDAADFKVGHSEAEVISEKSEPAPETEKKGKTIAEMSDEELGF